MKVDGLPAVPVLSMAVKMRTPTKGRSLTVYISDDCLHLKDELQEILDDASHMKTLDQLDILCDSGRSLVYYEQLCKVRARTINIRSAILIGLPKFNDMLETIVISDAMLERGSTAELIDALPSTVKNVALDSIEAVEDHCIPDSIDRLQDLESIILERVPLKSVSDRLYSLPNLSLLYMIRCSLQTISPAVINLPPYTLLALSHNSLTELPAELLDSDIIVSTDGNPIISAKSNERVSQRTSE